MTHSQSLDRGIKLLGLLDKSPEAQGVREIARQLGLSAAIVQRLLNTLAANHYVRQDPITRRYSIGYSALGLGTSLLRRDKLISAAQHELQQLAIQHELNGYLGALRDQRVMYLLSIQSDGPITTRKQPGDFGHLHTTAVGKALLAHVRPEEASTLIGTSPLARVTPASLTSADTLMQQLAHTRARGYAVAEEENTLGVTSVGAPIRNMSNETVAAVSVAFAERLSPSLNVSVVAPLILAAAERISRSLGWTGGTYVAEGKGNPT